MAYTSPHHGRVFLKAAALAVCHHYQMRVQYRSKKDRRKIVIDETAEIDICARVAGYFGANAYLSAQGSNQADVIVDGPTLSAEVKFLRRSATPWIEIIADWEWLRDLNATNTAFRKNGLLVFVPSKAYGTSGKYLRSFVSIPRSKLYRGRQVYCSKDFAPLMPFVRAETPRGKQRQQLLIKPGVRRAIIYAGRNRRTRPALAELIGKVTDPVWCILYTRLSPAETRSFVSRNMPVFQPTTSRILK